MDPQVQRFQALFYSIKEIIQRNMQPGKGHDFGLTIQEILQELNTNYVNYFPRGVSEREVSRVLTYQVNGNIFFDSFTRPFDNSVFWKNVVQEQQQQIHAQQRPPQLHQVQIPQLQPMQYQIPMQIQFQQAQQQQQMLQMQRQMQLQYQHVQQMQQAQQQQQQQAMIRRRQQEILQQIPDKFPNGQTAEELEAEIAELKKKLKPLEKKNEQLRMAAQMLNNPQLLESTAGKLETAVFMMKDTHAMIDEKVSNLIFFIDSELDIGE